MMKCKNHIVSLCKLGLLTIICCAAGIHPADYTAKWVTLKGCVVKVNGSTNVNRFACSVKDDADIDTITCTISKDNASKVIMSGRVELPVINFDCANRMMTKDLRKTLNEAAYPVFFIHFISMERYPLLKATPETVSGMVSIELAGIKKQVEINYQVSMDEQGIVELSGTQSICFSDFKLTPPRKMGGIIKTNDRLDVVFIIRCRIIKS